MCFAPLLVRSEPRRRLPQRSRAGVDMPSWMRGSILLGDGGMREQAARRSGLRHACRPLPSNGADHWLQLESCSSAGKRQMEGAILIEQCLRLIGESAHGANCFDAVAANVVHRVSEHVLHWIAKE